MTHSILKAILISQILYDCPSAEVAAQMIIDIYIS